MQFMSAFQNALQSPAFQQLLQQYTAPAPVKAAPESEASGSDAAAVVGDGADDAAADES